MKAHANPPPYIESFASLVRRMETVAQRANAQAVRAQKMKKIAREMHDQAVAMGRGLYRPILP